MGDISRHRDIFLNTREAIPVSLLDRCRIAADDLTYLELGNYLTDVSQFRDPVVYIFAKQKIWRERILPEVGDKADLIRGLTVLAGNAAAAALLAAGRPKNAAIGAALGALAGLVSNDLLAGIAGLDDWIDRMFGKPIERTPGDQRRRADKDYGYVGQFFQHFIEGITHLLFAKEIANKVTGDWGRIDRIPETSIAAVFKESFTQYYPHEHTDQPPYVWDASERPKHPKWYGPSRRQLGLAHTSGGIMNVVDQHYIQYLAEGLSKLEADWRKIKPSDADGRRRALVRLGKLLHGIEDWYFHSNVVELLHLRSHQPARREGEGEDDERFVQRFVREGLKKEPVFVSADRASRVGLQRRLYRRLRFPVYLRGNRANSAGIASRRSSTLNIDHAYPAFPSQQDTAHTLLGALENLERKGKGARARRTELPPWAPCVLGKIVAAREDVRQLVEQKATARGVGRSEVITALTSPSGPAGERVTAVIVDVLREWLPLVVTLLYESERQRLVADVDPLAWMDQGSAATPPTAGSPGTTEVDKQLERHKAALEPKAYAEGTSESNYERAVGYLGECGFLNTRGQTALRRAFEIDRQSQKLNERAPGSGGFLIQFAVDLQRALDEGDAATERLNGNESSSFDQASDNGAFSEIIGSHSLMSKDTPTSSPFFDDAKVMASVASQSILHIMLDEVGQPAADTGLDWRKILRHFIRFPVLAGGWERRAMIFFRENHRIPKFADLPELARLAQSARLPLAALEPWRKGTKVAELEEEYIKLERKVSHYRYP